MCAGLLNPGTPPFDQNLPADEAQSLSAKLAGKS